MSLTKEHLAFNIIYPLCLVSLYLGSIMWEDENIFTF